MNPDKINIHASWRSVLSDSFTEPYFDEIVSKLKILKANGTIVYPPGSLIFNAFNSTPFENLKVVIIGQDPYHNPHEAMGLSFSVPKGIKIPPSLKNIFKEINHDLKCPVPAHGDLSSWASQGVFLLNAILTVEQNKPGSHKDIGWQKFTDDVIRRISDHKNNVVFMLWGNFAKNKKALINSEKHLVLESAHPSPLAGNAFQGCGHFSKANEYLIENNLPPVRWDINS
ncbi:MAG: uracil-DNA glycosylase [Saprospiraceae bacterium]|nr:uracil-DNA glycosylase [Saprospiraceae bacterium]